MLSLKELEATDGMYLMDLFDYPLELPNAELLAMRMCKEAGVCMLVFYGDEAAGIIEMHGNEVGYRVRKAYRNKGIATKALRLFLKSHAGERIYAKCEKKNVASSRVLVTNGFVLVKEEGNICQYVWE